MIKHTSSLRDSNVIIPPDPTIGVPVVDTITGAPEGLIVGELPGDAIMELLVAYSTIWVVVEDAIETSDWLNLMSRNRMPIGTSMLAVSNPTLTYGYCPNAMWYG